MVAVLCLFLGTTAQRIDKARRQRDAIKELQSVGAFVTYDYEVTLDNEYVDDDSSVPKCLLRIFGKDFFHDVVILQIGFDSSNDSYPVVTQSDLSAVCHFKSLRTLVISCVADDIDISILSDLEHLKVLDLRSPVDESGLRARRPDISINVSWYH